ncbi:MAG: DUF5677 domain-containing protein [Saprospiraceae bacterium]
MSIEEILLKYREDITHELKYRWNNWDIDLSEKEKFEVISGLLCRQVTVMIHFSLSPSIWNPDLAPIILRTLIDNLINLSWICDDPLDRSRKFIYYGLGVEKLNTENRIKQMQEDNMDPNEDPYIEWSKSWIDSQRYSFLTEIDFGSWSGLSTRKMAEESDNIGLYNYTYQVFSSVAHNHWNHIGKFCMKQSDNPLHMLLHIPTLRDYEHLVHFLEMGANYLDRAFKRVDKLFQINNIPNSAYDLFLANIRALFANEDEGKEV